MTESKASDPLSHEKRRNLQPQEACRTATLGCGREQLIETGEKKDQVTPFQVSPADKELGFLLHISKVSGYLYKGLGVGREGGFPTLTLP